MFHRFFTAPRAGNRGFEIIHAYEVSERSERGRESTAQALRRREHHARLCLARAGNRGFEIIHAYKVSERSERGRESTAQALRRREHHARLCLARAGNCDLILNTLTKLASAASEAANRQRRHSAAVLIDSDVL